MSTTQQRFAQATLVLIVTLLPVALAAPPSGQTAWGRWRFTWVAGAQSEGLALKNVRYDDELVLYKASMPVVRVQYPSIGVVYGDLIGEGTLRPVPWCGNATVCQRSFTSGGREWLELGVLAQLGQYRMYQVWYLSADGYIQPYFSSKGLHHPNDHTHHVYWRYDFDIGGAAGDQLFVYDNNRPDEGWGAGWRLHETEYNELKSPATRRVWFVRDNAGGHGTWIMPGAADGQADGFSSLDAAGRRYKAAEAGTWPFGGYGELGYDEAEGVVNRDVVFWYVPHLFHEAAEGPDKWHQAGPTLYLAR